MERKTMQEHWHEAKGICREQRERGKPEFPTGISFLDRLTGGFRRGEVWIIAGKSGGGKTTLALQMAKSFADDPNHSVLFLSLEMRGWDLALRLFSEMMNIKYDEMKDGKVEIPESEAKIFEDYISTIDFEVVEDGYRFEQIERIIEENYSEKHPDVIIIDYIQFIQWTQFGEERTALMEYIRKIHEMANKYNIGFVVVSQLRRLPSGVNYDRPPDMIDLKGSGALEQTADKVIMLYRIVEDGMSPRHILKLAKNRQGKTDKQQVIFKGEYYRFEDIEGNKEVQSIATEFGGTIN